MTYDKQEVTQTEHGINTTKPAKKRGCGAHFKRFWWIYLIAFIVIAVVAIVVIIFVAVPKIAQHKLDEAKLEVQSVAILDSRADKYRMQINSTIETDGKIKADIDAFEGVMYLEDVPGHTPFTTINFPKTNANKHQTVNVDQEITITDREAFDQFNIWFVNNETLRVTVAGKTQVKPKGLAKKYNVDFKKTITMKGLNLLKGTEVVSGHIGKADKAGNNFNGTAEIPNASYFTLDIGNATFKNFIEDDAVGKLFIKNLLLVPGKNTVEITAALDQIKVLGAAQGPKYCKEGVVPFKLLGDGVENRGQQLEYFAAGLASANQTVPMNLGKLLGATIKCSS